MRKGGSWIVLAIMLLSLLGGCTALAGGTGHWPASLLAVVVLIPFKIINDRYKLVKWPMDFLLIAAVTMIVFNLTYLYFTPPPF